MLCGDWTSLIRSIASIAEFTLIGCSISHSICVRHCAYRKRMSLAFEKNILPGTNSSCCTKVHFCTALHCVRQVKWKTDCHWHPKKMYYAIESTDPFNFFKILHYFFLCLSYLPQILLPKIVFTINSSMDQEILVSYWEKYSSMATSNVFKCNVINCILTP